jgi:hypothetical protein
VANLADIKAFDFLNSTVTLWTFKGVVPDINGHWIETTDDLDEELKNISRSQLAEISEEAEYSLLAQNNEGSLLSIPADETAISEIADAMGVATPGRRTRDVKTLRNARFYVARMVHNGQVVLGVRKTDSSWKTRAAVNVLTAIYKDRELQLAEDESFRIERSFDFYVINNKIFIYNKRNFESILNYRAAHEDDFSELQAETEFYSLFSDLTELNEYIGINRIQLRRISAIRLKAFYRDAAFMANLRTRHAEFGLNIQFDVIGRIVPTSETCRDIMTALLDHRLRSGFSGNTYDVPDATQI